MITKMIIGFPRTGTTLMYSILKKQAPSDSVGLYEPFYHVIREYILYDTPVIHNRQGVIQMEYNQLPQSLRDLIVTNQLDARRWLRDNNSDSNLLGRFWMDILTELHKLETPVIIKEICAWIYLKEIRNKFPDVEIISTAHDFTNIQNSYSLWFKAWEEWGRQMIPDDAKKIFRSGVWVNSNAFSTLLIGFYRTLFPSEKFQKESWVKSLKKIYNTYLEIVNDAQVSVVSISDMLDNS